MSNWQMVGILGLAAIAECWVLAVVLYRVGTSGSVARKLALLLVVEGITLLTAGYPEYVMEIDLVEFSNRHALYFPVTFALHTFGDCAMLALYPPFLDLALRTKLTRPFAGRRGRIGAALTALALFLAVQFTPEDISATLLYLALSLLFGYALVASIHAWQVAAPGTARTRAGIFATAFGLRDLCWGLVYGSSIWQIWAGSYFALEPTLIDGLIQTVYALGTLIAIPVIAYGILRTQLFDIDLRIRWTIKQSTLAGVFIAVMFLISEGASTFLSAELGNVAGLLAAAVLMFFLAPLQRFAERVASTAMPNTMNTPEYAAFRKMQVYEAALAEAQHEEGISDRERALLVRLRDSLGISAVDADLIERDLLSQLSR